MIPPPLENMPSGRENLRKDAKASLWSDAPQREASGKASSFPRGGGTDWNPLVSVVIPTYNREKMLVEAIQSVLDQTYKNVEVIVVDDGSTDNTRSAVEAFPEKVRYLHQPHHKFPNGAAARNKGAAAANGELVAFLDSDDLWLPEKLEEQMAYLRRHPETAMVFTDMIWMEADGAQIPSHFRRHRTQDGFVLEEVIRHPCVAIPTVLVQKEIFNTIRFSETMRYGVGVDFGIRLAVHHAVGLVEKPLVVVRHHDGNVSKNRGIAYRSDLDNQYIDFFEHFEQIRQVCPELDHQPYAAQARRGLGRVYLDWGVDLYLTGRIPEARAKLHEAWKRGIRSDAWLQFMKTWVPKGVRGAVKRVLKRERK